MCPSKIFFLYDTTEVGIYIVYVVPIFHRLIHTLRTWYFFSNIDTTHDNENISNDNNYIFIYNFDAATIIFTKYNFYNQNYNTLIT